MERITKDQKQILKYLYDDYPYRVVPIEELFSELEDKYDEEDVLLEVRFLEGKELIKSYESQRDRVIKKLSSGDAHFTPREFLGITPKGIEKLRENFITRLVDNAWQNPWTAIAIVLPVVISVIFGLITWHYYSENLDLQKQIKQENELKQIMPPTISLTQKFENGSFGQLKIIPALKFKKNSERLFTISTYEINISLNGKYDSTARGLPLEYRNEGIEEGTITFGDFYPSIYYYNFFHGRNDLLIDYVLEIKDMDSQIKYRGNVTTEINSSNSYLKSIPTGREPILFNWTKI